MRGDRRRAEFVNFQGSDHADQNRALFLIDFLEIRVAAVALDAPQAGGQKLGRDPAIRIDAIGEFNGGLGADTHEAPLVIAPCGKAGFVLLPVLRVLKEVIGRAGFRVVFNDYLEVDFSGERHGKASSNCSVREVNWMPRAWAYFPIRSSAQSSAVSAA